MRRSVVFALIILLPSLLSANPQQSTIKETLVPLGHSITGEEIYVTSLKISPDLKHIGYVSRIGNSFRVWMDGVSNKSHSGITQQSPFFSPHKNRLAYVANENGQMFVVIDGQEHDRYKTVGAINFSPDGSRIAYRAADAKGRQMVVVDDEPGPAFDVGIANDVGIVFSPDSQHVAYVGLNNLKSCIFIKDNKKMRSFEQIAQVKFSTDSQRVAYAAMENNKWFVMVDDKKGAEYSMVNDLQFSPDGSRVVYTAEKNRRRIIISNNEEITGGEGVIVPTFSPDGRRFAFLMIEKGNKFSYVLDGKPQLPVDNPGRMIFSHDSTSAAYAAEINQKWHIIKDGVQGPGFNKIYAFSYAPGSNDILYAADTDNGKSCVVLNDVPGKPYSTIGAPVLCDTGKKYGYVAKYNDQEMFMVVNSEEQKPYPIIGILLEDDSGKFNLTKQQPFFSSKGNRLAYPVFDPGTKSAYMVVDGKPDPSFDAVMLPVFSDDEKHVAYMAKKGDKWRMVVDGQAGANKCDGMIRGATIAFSADRCFFILVASKTESGLSFFRMEAKVD